MFRKLCENAKATVDLSVVLMIGIAFAGLMVIGYIIWQIYDQFNPTAGTDEYATLTNITGGFDDAVNFLLVAITIFILAIAIAALLMLRGRR